MGERVVVSGRSACAGCGWCAVAGAALSDSVSPCASSRSTMAAIAPRSSAVNRCGATGRTARFTTRTSAGSTSCCTHTFRTASGSLDKLIDTNQESTYTGEGEVILLGRMAAWQELRGGAHPHGRGGGEGGEHSGVHICQPPLQQRPLSHGPPVHIRLAGRPPHLHPAPPTQALSYP